MNTIKNSSIALFVVRSNLLEYLYHKDFASPVSFPLSPLSFLTARRQQKIHNLQRCMCMIFRHQAVI